MGGKDKAMATRKTTKAEEAIEEVEEKSSDLRFVQFEYNGCVYTMEFNRRSVEVAEQRFGISITELQSGKMAYLPGLFQCSLLMHHPHMKQSTVDMLFNRMENKLDLMMCLMELYANAINSMFEEPEEGKAISWTRH